MCSTSLDTSLALIVGDRRYHDNERVLVTSLPSLLIVGVYVQPTKHVHKIATRQGTRTEHCTELFRTYLIVNQTHIVAQLHIAQDYPGYSP